MADTHQALESNSECRFCQKRGGVNREGAAKSRGVPLDIYTYPHTPKPPFPKNFLYFFQKRFLFRKILCNLPWCYRHKYPQPG